MTRLQALDSKILILKALEEYRESVNTNDQIISVELKDDSSRPNDVLRSRNKKAAADNNDAIDRLLSSVFETPSCVGNACEVDEEQVLCKLLNTRTQYIENRYQTILKFLDSSIKDSNIMTMPPPISPYLFYITYADKDSKERKGAMNRVRENADLRFQTLNALIIDMFYKCIAKSIDFSPETIKLVDCAEDLHSVLSGKEMYSGNVDDLTPFGKIDALFQAITPDPQKLTPAYFFQRVISRRKISKMNHRSTAPSGCISSLLSYYSKDVSAEKRNSSLNKDIPFRTLMHYAWHIQKEQLFVDDLSERFLSFITKSNHALGTNEVKYSWLHGFLGDLKRAKEASTTDASKALIQEDSFFAHYQYENTSEDDTASDAESVVPIVSSSKIADSVQQDVTDSTTAIPDRSNYSYNPSEVIQSSSQCL